MVWRKPSTPRRRWRKVGQGRRWTRSQLLAGGGRATFMVTTAALIDSHASAGAGPRLSWRQKFSALGRGGEQGAYLMRTQLCATSDTSQKPCTGGRAVVPDVPMADTVCIMVTRAGATRKGDRRAGTDQGARPSSVKAKKKNPRSLRRHGRVPPVAAMRRDGRLPSSLLSMLRRRGTWGCSRLHVGSGVGEVEASRRRPPHDSVQYNMNSDQRHRHRRPLRTPRRQRGTRVRVNPVVHRCQADDSRRGPTEALPNSRYGPARTLPPPTGDGVGGGSPPSAFRGLMRACDAHSRSAKLPSIAGGCSSVREAVVESQGPDTMLRQQARSV